VADENEPIVESDLRRRAAWLLGMLGIVAVLLIVVMTALIGSDNGTKPSDNAGPLDSSITGPGHTTSSTHHTSAAAGHSTTAAPSTTAATSTTAGAHAGSCPTASRCALPDDIGNAIAAVNTYRAQHGKPALPGAVSDAAKACALANGSGCKGSWAESQVPSPDGTAAVAKLLTFAKLLDPQMTSFGVGWAYDPGSKQYFFAIVRNG
jgi:hypothetical protein